MLKIATALSAAIAIINRSLQLRNPSRCTPPRCLYAAGTVPATPTQTPHPFPTYSPPSRAADSPPHTSTAPLHTAPIPPDSATRPALALPTLVPCRTLHHPSLRNRHTFDAYPLRAVPPHRRLSRPLRRPPSRPVGKRRSITQRPFLPTTLPQPSTSRLSTSCVHIAGASSRGCFILC